MPRPSVIHRFQIPVDGHPRILDIAGDLLHAAVRHRPDLIDVWAYARPDGMKHMRRSFLIVGTGHTTPLTSQHVATCLTPDGALVWHVLENLCTHQAVRDTGEGKQGRAGVCCDCGLPLLQRGTEPWLPA